MNIHQRFGSLKLSKNTIFIVTFGSVLMCEKIAKVRTLRVWGGILNFLYFDMYQSYTKNDRYLILWTNNL